MELTLEVRSRIAACILQQAPAHILEWGGVRRERTFITGNRGSSTTGSSYRGYRRSKLYIISFMSARVNVHHGVWFGEIHRSDLYRKTFRSAPIRTEELRTFLPTRPRKMKQKIRFWAYFLARYTRGWPAHETAFKCKWLHRETGLRRAQSSNQGTILKPDLRTIEG